METYCRVTRVTELIKRSSRVTAHTETIIDHHLYASNGDFVYDVSVPAIAISDHYHICFTCSASRKQFKRQAHKTIQHRCYAKLSEERFHHDLPREMAVINISCEGENTNRTSAFMKIFNKNAPLKSKRVKRETQQECHNDEIKLARKKRDAFHKTKIWKEYKAWRNKTTAFIRSAKKGFFARSSDQNKNYGSM